MIQTQIVLIPWARLLVPAMQVIQVMEQRAKVSDVYLTSKLQTIKVSDVYLRSKLQTHQFFISINTNIIFLPLLLPHA